MAVLPYVVSHISFGRAHNLKHCDDVYCKPAVSTASFVLAPLYVFKHKDVEAAFKKVQPSLQKVFALVDGYRGTATKMAQENPMPLLFGSSVVAFVFMYIFWNYISFSGIFSCTYTRIRCICAPLIGSCDVCLTLQLRHSAPCCTISWPATAKSARTQTKCGVMVVKHNTFKYISYVYNTPLSEQ